MSDVSGLVNYFEVGCKCVLSGELPKILEGTATEREDYYLARCQCSRHPLHSKSQGRTYPYNTEDK